MTYDPWTALIYFIITSLGIYGLWKISRSTSLFHNRHIVRKTLIEDILKQLYHVEYSGRKASLNAMAGALKLKDAKLIKLIEIMTQGDLIKIDNHLLSLTSSGRDYALKIIRVHRLWEKYLSERTGYHKSEWHDLAEYKEHRMTLEETRKLNDSLGNPRFDPHGDPIPTEKGEIIQTGSKPLSQLDNNSLARIVHIEDEPDVIYQQIIKKKLHIGSQVKIIHSDEHQLQFYSEGNEYNLSSIVASNISVEELNDHELFEENTIRLSALKPGERAMILGISSDCRGAARRRLLDLGFISGTSVETEYTGPDGELKAYLIRNTLIALRPEQSDFILIEKKSNE